MQTLLSLILKCVYFRAKTNQAKDDFYYTLCLLLLVSTLFLNYHTLNSIYDNIKSIKRSNWVLVYNLSRLLQRVWGIVCNRVFKRRLYGFILRKTLEVVTKTC